MLKKKIFSLDGRQSTTRGLFSIILGAKWSWESLLSCFWRLAPNTPFPHFRFLYDFTSSSWYRISPQNRYQTNSEWSIGGRIVNIMSPNDTTHKQRSKRLPKPHIPSQNLAVDAVARNRWFRYSFACLMLFDTAKSQEPDTGLYNRGMNV